MNYKAGGLVPQQLSDTVYGIPVNEVMHFEFLHLGDSRVAEEVDCKNRYVYALAILDDVNSFGTY